MFASLQQKNKDFKAMQGIRSKQGSDLVQQAIQILLIN